MVNNEGEPVRLCLGTEVPSTDSGPPIFRGISLPFPPENSLADLGMGPVCKETDFQRNHPGVFDLLEVGDGLFPTT